MMQATMEFRIPARIRRKGKWFISSCDLLDVHSQGHSRDEAGKNLQEALASFLISCYERGTLDQVLHEARFVAMTPRKSKNGSAVKKFRQVTVPLPFRVRGPHSRAAAAE